jgi:NADPH-dependent 2,4-dienoyl-CoA reductase/sulfur reductase-like enzyme
VKRQPDLLVVGGGPAGIGAALAASAQGVDTVLVDTAPTAGGQIYRSMPATFRLRPGAAPDPDRAQGQRLREALAGARVSHVTNHQVWSVGTDLRVDALGAGGPVWWRPRAIVAATGATERVVPFPGWTLPGVIGLAAATILLKSQQMLPGASTVVAGCGPLLFAVAHKIVKSGGRVVAVVDLAGRGDWLRGAGSMLARPRDLGRGLAWIRDLRSAGVPLLFGHAVHAVREGRGPAGGEGDDALAVDVVPVDARRRAVAGAAARTLRAHCVTVGHGLVPATELTRALGARHAFDALAGGWVPVLDNGQRTSVAGLYAAGDGAGVAGAAAALEAGRVAGLTVALDQGRMDAGDWARVGAGPRRALARARRFGRAAARLMALRGGQVEAIAPGTVVCRCEDVTRAEVDAAIDDGARELNQIKSWTRCGMGPCQGRMCADTIGAIVAARLGSREAAGAWTARAPFRPLDVQSLTGEYEYADIPIPQAAPL